MCVCATDSKNQWPQTCVRSPCARSGPRQPTSAPNDTPNATLTNACPTAPLRYRGGAFAVTTKCVRHNTAGCVIFPDEEFPDLSLLSALVLIVDGVSEHRGGIPSTLGRFSRFRKLCRVGKYARTRFQHPAASLLQLLQK